MNNMNDLNDLNKKVTDIENEMTAWQKERAAANAEIQREIDELRAKMDKADAERAKQRSDLSDIRKRLKAYKALRG